MFVHHRFSLALYNCLLFTLVPTLAPVHVITCVSINSNLGVKEVVFQMLVFRWKRPHLWSFMHSSRAAPARTNKQFYCTSLLLLTSVKLAETTRRSPSLPIVAHSHLLHGKSGEGGGPRKTFREIRAKKCKFASCGLPKKQYRKKCEQPCSFNLHLGFWFVKLNEIR